MLPRQHLTVGTTLSLLVATLVSCGTGEPICGLPRQEPPDPASSLHVFDDSALEWSSTAPTSGPHRAAVPRGGLQVDEVHELDQIAFLEAGGVVVQVRGEQVPDAVADLASSTVMIAPRSELSDTVVATAWTWRLRCSGIDIGPLRSFISDRAGSREGH